MTKSQITKSLGTVKLWEYRNYSGDVPRRPSYGVYISQIIKFASVDDFNARNKCLTAKLLKQGYRYHKLRKACSAINWFQNSVSD